MNIVAIVLSGITFLWGLASIFVIHGQNKKIQAIKSRDEKSNHISKVQFDAEFKLYQEISSSLYKCVSDNSQLFPFGLDRINPLDKEGTKKIYKERFENAVKSYNEFSENLFKYAPFINKGLFDEFDELRIMCIHQINLYPDLIMSDNSQMKAEMRKSLIDADEDCWRKTPLISAKYKGLSDSLREYLASLKVID